MGRLCRPYPQRKKEGRVVGTAATSRTQAKAHRDSKDTSTSINSEPVGGTRQEGNRETRPERETESHQSRKQKRSKQARERRRQRRRENRKTRRKEWRVVLARGKRELATPPSQPAAVYTPSDSKAGRKERKESKRRKQEQKETTEKQGRRQVRFDKGGRRRKKQTENKYGRQSRTVEVTRRKKKKISEGERRKPKKGNRQKVEEGAGWKKRDKRRVGNTKQQKLRMATINCKGINEIGKRQQIKQWMQDKKIDIAFLQETKVKEQTHETGDTHTIYLASDPKEHSEVRRDVKGKGKGKGVKRSSSSKWKVETAGVGVIITKELNRSLLDIRQVSSRIISVDIKTIPRLRIIGCYAPQAAREEEIKETFYTQLQGEVERMGTSKPLILTGDFNVRLHERQEDESDIMGKWIHNKGHKKVNEMSTQTKDNRHRFVEMARRNKLIITNTTFERKNYKLATFREIGTKEGQTHEGQEEGYAQLDYTLISQRWRNGITNVRTDQQAQLDTDHFPLITEIRIKPGKDKSKNTTNKKDIKDKQAAETFRNMMEEKSLHIATWEKMEESMQEAKKEAFADKAEKPRQDYITNETWEKIKNRRTTIRKIKELEDNINGEQTDKEREEMETTIHKYKTEEREKKKDIKKSLRKDRDEMVSRWVEEDLDIRDQWAGIRRQKTEYKARPFERRDKDGKEITIRQQAEATAEYLTNKQWGTNTEEEELTKQISNNKIGKKSDKYRTNDFAPEELERAINTAKNNKVPGPDGLEAEIFKSLGREGKITLLIIINNWWHNADMDSEILKANIASLYKKGDYKNQENYRPISLLNQVYKLTAHLIRERLKEGIEEELQQTQYGFRSKRSTVQAIHCVRRTMEKAERSGEELHVVLLDWEKAFDKITHSSLLKTLERFNVPAKLINAIKMLYNEPTFTVNINGGKSKQKKQNTGIRQGCPLSPYLFLIVMTAIWKDINAELEVRRAQHPSRYRTKITDPDPPPFNEVLYADDTILLQTKAKWAEEQIELLEREANKYGLKLNQKNANI